MNVIDKLYELPKSFCLLIVIPQDPDIGDNFLSIYLLFPLIFGFMIILNSYILLMVVISYVDVYIYINMWDPFGSIELILLVILGLPWLCVIIVDL